ncbi:MAG: prepilin-type N-terminal cleavage/methylation domain-containing protein [Gammaproteobacteria bacterium]|nr:prepilin-type N-terminal cleavage/methylation domain-containing protein [Gammaproteobacteria bacterium]
MSMHQQMRKQLNSQKGFTLIEIAIVLVIIGLLLGGVLKGQELINTARVRSLNNSVDGITAAWFSFQDRYRAFPGDYLNARSTVNLPGAPAGGDGNGRVGDVAGADNPAERGLVWVHLEAAGYITGGYDGVAIAAGNEYVCTVTTCPDNGFGTGMSIFHGAEGQVAGAANAHELITGQGIPVDVLAELDRKIDDGAATTGLMQIGNGAAIWDAAASAACINVTAYQLQVPSDNCAAVFRNF